MTTPPKKRRTPAPTGACVGQSSLHPDHNTLWQRLAAPARRNAPPGTSEVAAARISGHAAAQRAAVLAVIVRAGAYGATDAEIELVTGLRAQSVSPRRGELRTLGLIVDSGMRRPTPRGRPAAVWIATKAPTVAPDAPADRGEGVGGAA